MQDERVSQRPSRTMASFDFLKREAKKNRPRRVQDMSDFRPNFILEREKRHYSIPPGPIRKPVPFRFKVASITPRQNSLRSVTAFLTARASPLWCYRLSSDLTACLSPAYHSYRSCPRLSLQGCKQSFPDSHLALSVR